MEQAANSGSAQHTPGLTQLEQAMLNTLEMIQSNLHHQRRFGADTYTAWRNACVRAEGDIEEAVINIKETARLAAIAKSGASNA